MKKETKQKGENHYMLPGYRTEKFHGLRNISIGFLTQPLDYLRDYFHFFKTTVIEIVEE